MPENSTQTGLQTKSIVFGGGCFWCTEAVFQMVRGVKKVYPGYAGGRGSVPSYDRVSTGATGYAEVIKVDYDPAEISLEDLLTVFFTSHDPTTLNRQGADVGTQYRSIILYSDEAEKAIIEKFIENLNLTTRAGEPIVTEVEPLEKFYPAESFHADYYNQNKAAPYCQLVINPKLEGLQKRLPTLLKS